MKKDYEIGYGKPPVASQFTKGKSGNPKGRRRKPGYTEKPQRTTSAADELLHELQQVITINEGGKKKKITKQQALMKSLVDQALAGNSKALSLVWASVTKYGWDQTPQDVITYTVTKEQVAELKAVLADENIFKVPDDFDG
jgi:hypothetical protein